MDVASRVDVADAEGNPLTSDVGLSVKREGSASSALRLGAIWPNEWMAQ
jgi:hypothetical protein